jgi:hypothetical protein
MKQMVLDAMFRYYLDYVCDSLPREIHSNDSVNCFTCAPLDN